MVGGFCLLLTITILILAWYRGWPDSFLWDAAGIFVTAVVCSGLSWYYDVILLKLTPDGYQLLTVWLRVNVGLRSRIRDRSHLYQRGAVHKFYPPVMLGFAGRYSVEADRATHSEFQEPRDHSARRDSTD